jgi:hypothetical protein
MRRVDKNLKLSKLKGTKILMKLKTGKSAKLDRKSLFNKGYKKKRPG